MPETVKFAISLPRDEFERIESRRGALSRSAYVRKAITWLEQQIEDEAAVAAFVESYRRYPETDEEKETGLALAAMLTADDDEWEE